MDLGIEGQVTFKCRDTRSGEVKVFSGANTILDDFLDNWFISSTPLFSPLTFNACVLGTGDSLPYPSDPGLSGSTLAQSLEGIDVEDDTYFYRNYETPKDVYESYIPEISYKRQWFFPAGVGTGIIREAALTTEDGRWVARKLIEPSFNKTRFHELTVEWRVVVTNDLTSSFVTRDDPLGRVIHWTFSSDDHQLYQICTGGQGLWFGYMANPVVSAHSSNSEEFPLSSSGNGTLIDSREVIVTAEPYTPGSLRRTFSFSLDSNVFNGSIGELILQDLARITFNPKLEKTSDFGLLIPVTIGWNRSRL